MRTMEYGGRTFTVRYPEGYLWSVGEYSHGARKKPSPPDRALMIVPWLIFIAMGLITYAGLIKLAAGLLRYKVSWKSSFLFAVVMLVLVIFDHVLAFDQPIAIRFLMMVVVALAIALRAQVFLSKHFSPSP